jgi:Transposase
MAASYSRKSELRATRQGSRKCLLPSSPGGRMGQQRVWLALKRCTTIHPILAIQTLWLLFKEKRTDVEQQFVQSLLEQSDLIGHTYESLRRFRQILTERDETALPLWAYEAEASQIPELKRFVQRVRLDWEAVENALLFASSQGQVEGQVNRLKVFQRQSYGRASPALLQARLMEASNLYRKCA